MKVAIISVSLRGARLAQQVKHSIASDAVCYCKEGKGTGQEEHSFSSLKAIIGTVFHEYAYVLCIMATGIVVRLIAPYIEHKSKDPAIVVMDERGQHAISLLSGHLGGANEWAQTIALAVGADPVITTATDVNGLPAPDVLARQLQMKVESFTALVAVNAAIVAGETVPYYVDGALFEADQYVAHATEFVAGHSNVSLWDGVSPIPGPAVLISHRLVTVGDAVLVLRPPAVTVGIGCRRDTPMPYIAAAVQDVMDKHQLSPLAVHTAASVDVKSDEQGLLDAVANFGWSIVFYSKEEMAPLIEALGLEESSFVKSTIGVGNVCETTALLAAKSHTLLQQKAVYPQTTVAVAWVPFKSLV